jgi:hypothetical protein
MTKEKNLEDYVGKTFKGFKFENRMYNGLDYNNSMNYFIGKELKIISYDKYFNSFHTDSDWHYPTDLVIEQLEKQETEIETFKPKRGDKVLVWDYYEEYAEERIFLTEIEGTEYPYVCVNKDTEEHFINGNVFDTTKWKNIKPLPKKEIPKDTLVWCKNSESSVYEQRFYSHFENGKHYCFINQEKSNQTENILPWNIVTDINPFN